MSNSFCTIRAFVCLPMSISVSNVCSGREEGWGRRRKERERERVTKKGSKILKMKEK